MSAGAEVDTRSGVRAAADRLLRALDQGTPCLPVRDLLSDQSPAAGYAVQSLITEQRLARGARIVGRKVGLTSTAVQAQLGVDSPDFGVLFDDMVSSTHQVISMTRLIAPRIEAEVAFILGADLDGDTSPDAVRAATLHVVPALEIVDSRIANWDITLVDTVADNASSARYVLGEHPMPLGGFDLRSIEMTMVDAAGAVVSTGTGAACLGDPVLAMAWLAGTALELGSPLRAGDVVLSGALGPMVAVTAGSGFTANLTGLGTVTASFGTDAG